MSLSEHNAENRDGKRPPDDSSAGGNPADAEPHPVERCAGGEIERPPISIAPGDVCRLLRHPDPAQQPAERVEDPDAAGAGAVDVPLAVHLHPVRAAAALALEHG